MIIKWILIFLTLLLVVLLTFSVLQAFLLTDWLIQTVSIMTSSSHKSIDAEPRPDRGLRSSTCYTGNSAETLQATFLMG